MNEIRCYDYVNHPYERVRDALSGDALALFQSAAKAAASRAESIASQLRVDVGGVRVATDIKISVKNVEEKRPRLWSRRRRSCSSSGRLRKRQGCFR